MTTKSIANNSMHFKGVSQKRAISVKRSVKIRILI